MTDSQWGFPGGRILATTKRLFGSLATGLARHLFSPLASKASRGSSVTHMRLHASIRHTNGTSLRA